MDSNEGDFKNPDQNQEEEKKQQGPNAQDAYKWTKRAKNLKGSFGSGGAGTGAAGSATEGAAAAEGAGAAGSAAAGGTGAAGASGAGAGAAGGAAAGAAGSAAAAGAAGGTAAAGTAVAATPVGWIAIGIGIAIAIIFIIIFFFSKGSGGAISDDQTGASGTDGTPGSGANPNASSDISCYTSMSGDDMNTYFASNGYMFFNNTGTSLAEFAEKYKINPALIIAIGRTESQLGNAYQSDPEALAKKNAFGLMGTGGLMAFSSWEEGADIAYKSVASYNCTTLECIQQSYAPVGASNDPNNLNLHWLNSVRSILSEIPHTSCQPPAGTNISDWPIQKPISSCSVTQRPGEGFSHPNLNAVDLGLPHGTQIYSTMDGTASINIYPHNCFGGCPAGQGLGTYVKVSNENSWAIYAHFIPDSVSHLSQGQAIKKGDYLGQVDNTGYSDGDHLHYELSPDLTFPDYDSACK